MPDLRISTLGTLIADGSDLIVVVDVSDNSMAATGTNKKFTLAALKAYVTAGVAATWGQIGGTLASQTDLVAALSATQSANNISSGTLAAARGGAGAITGILKANGSGVVSAAIAGTDYIIVSQLVSVQDSIYAAIGGKQSSLTFSTGLTLTGSTLSVTNPYNPAAFNATGGTMVGVAITNSPISGSTGAFTTLSATGALYLGTQQGGGYTGFNIIPANDGYGNATINFGNGFFIDSIAGQMRVNTDTHGFLVRSSGATRFYVDAGGVAVVDSLSVGSSGQILVGPAANTLAIRNGTNAQAFQVYNTYTDGSNYSRLAINCGGNYIAITPEKAGTGTIEGMILGGDCEVFYLSPRHRFRNGSNVDLWEISSSGHFLAASDNTYDIGASGANRPRDIYAAGTLTSSYARLTGLLFLGNDGRGVIAPGPSQGTILLWNSSGTDFDRLQLGGTTASFPAIKRTGSDLEIVKADGTTADTAVILSSPNGTRYRVTVANDGTLVRTAL